MSRPYIHPKSGMLYFRKGVPLRLQPLVGKTLVKISLRTRDPEEAKHRHAIIADQVAEEWRRLEAGPAAVEEKPGTSLTLKETVALAGEMYSEIIAAYGDDPGRASYWQDKLSALALALPDKLAPPGGPKRLMAGTWSAGANMMAGRILGPTVGDFLARRGPTLDTESRNRLYAHAAPALAQAYRELIKRIDGDFRADPDVVRFPVYVPPVQKLVAKFTTWKELYELYFTANKPAPSSRKRQKGVLTALFT